MSKATDSPAVHSDLGRVEELAPLDESRWPTPVEIPVGLCRCGCGRRTAIASRTERAANVIKGQPYHYVHGHGRRGRMFKRRPAQERFWKKVEKTMGGCWQWCGAIKGGTGYGSIYVDGHNVTAHRFAYELCRGPIPHGLTIDHLCRNRACVNPAHMEPVTHTENMRRGQGFSGKNFQKTQCKRGHPFDGQNTVIDANGSRQCRVCISIREARRGPRTYKRRSQNG